MNISQILSPQATFCGLKLSSKKKVLEKISEVMAESIACKPLEIFESLLAREKLGTTALGQGIAIPHGRVEACEKVSAVFILLDEAIDYGTSDGQMVDIVFGILVPEKADALQLKCLAEIANILSDKTLVSQIRHAHNDEALFDIIAKAAGKIK